MTDIFVFGSNKLGIHGAGAALTARLKYGAKTGDCSGRTGNAYAIPTKNTPSKDKRQIPLNEILEDVLVFLRYAAKHPELTFIVTRVGCGLAGYLDSEIAYMFADYTPNVKLPAEWLDIANKKED